jgi:hypothetical protein
MDTFLNAEEQVLYALIGRTLTDPVMLARWRQDAAGFHAANESSGMRYDTREFDRRLIGSASQPESQMQAVLADMLEQARAGFQSQIGMANTIFRMGQWITGAAVLFEALYLLGFLRLQWEQALVGGGVMGSMGLGSLIMFFMRDPQVTIQNALGKLAQSQVAFLSFMSQIRAIELSQARSPQETDQLLAKISALRSETLSDIQQHQEKLGVEVSLGGG